MTPKQEAFIQEYLIDLNATQAATRAGYSARTANEQGARLLANVSVRKAIEEAKALRASKVGVDAAWVLNEAVQVYGIAKSGLDPKDANPALVTAALKGLDTIGKHVGVQAFKEKIEHSGTIFTDQVKSDAESFTGAIAGIASRE
ncbi:MAG: terminase small subunit [Shewanella sp.]